MGMELVAALASVAAAVCAATAIAMQVRAHRELERSRARMDEASEQMARANEALVSVQSVLSQVLTTTQATLNQAASTSIIEQQHFDSQVRAIDQVSSKADEARREIAQNLEQNRGAVEQRLDKVRETVDVQLSAIRRDNELKLEAIRATVDEKLATTLNDRLGASFKQVSSQLEAVYRGLGDMQNIASGVGDLKRVLSNVKTRGILGEVQLGAILRDILTADQYAENVATKPGSAERVEFAVKLPVEGGDPIWLPIDSKFPGTPTSICATPSRRAMRKGWRRRAEPSSR